MAKSKVDPLSFLPSAKAVREALQEQEEIVRKFRILLDVAERVESADYCPLEYKEELTALEVKLFARLVLAECGSESSSSATLAATARCVASSFGLRLSSQAIERIRREA